MFVPQNLRGQGLADKIVEYAIGFAVKNGVKIKTSCSYIAEYVKNHKAFNDVVFQRDAQPQIQQSV
jgi:hypothetical protein